MRWGWLLVFLFVAAMIGIADRYHLFTLPTVAAKPSQAVAAPPVVEYPVRLSDYSIKHKTPFNLAGGDYRIQWETNGECGRYGFIDRVDGPSPTITLESATKTGSVSRMTWAYNLPKGRYLAVVPSDCEWSIEISRD